MNHSAHDVEPVTLSEVLGIATWERERTSDELQGFIGGKALDFSEIYESLS